MVTYSVTDEKSFEGVKKWMEDIEKVFKTFQNIQELPPYCFIQYTSANVPVMFLGSKCDIKESRRVSEERGRMVRLH